MGCGRGLVVLWVRVMYVSYYSTDNIYIIYFNDVITKTSKQTPLGRINKVNVNDNIVISDENIFFYYDTKGEKNVFCCANRETYIIHAERNDNDIRTGCIGTKLYTAEQ